MIIETEHGFRVYERLNDQRVYMAFLDRDCNCTWGTVINCPLGEAPGEEAESIELPEAL